MGAQVDQHIAMHRFRRQRAADAQLAFDARQHATRSQEHLQKLHLLGFQLAESARLKMPLQAGATRLAAELRDMQFAVADGAACRLRICLSHSIFYYTLWISLLSSPEGFSDEDF